MKRKVIQIADSTQLISLPRKWALAHGIKKGDEIEVKEDGANIIVSTEKDPKIDEITIDVKGLTPLLVTRLVARAYQKGYDVLNIMADKPEVIRAIQDKIQELIGFEILEKNKDGCRVEIISSRLEINFDSALRKAFLTLVDMAQECWDGFNKSDKSALENLWIRDIEINKFCYFCLRAINKGERHSFGDFALHYLIESLEDSGDEYKELSKALLKVGFKQNTIKELLSQLNEMVKGSYDFFYKPEKDKAIKAIKNYEEIKGKIEQSLKTNNSNEIKALTRIWYITELLYKFPTIQLDNLKVKE